MEEKKLTGYPSIDKPWLKYYSEEAINACVPSSTIYQYIWNCNKDNLNSIALNYFGNRITYKKLFRRIEDAAKAFVYAGIKKGDVVSLCVVSMPETVYSIYALNKIGAVSNLIEPRTNASQIRDRIVATQSRLLIVADVFYNKIRTILDDTAVKSVIVISVSASMPILPHVYYKLFKSKKALMPQFDGYTMKWLSFIQTGKNTNRMITASYQPNTPAAIIYTGGTTGLPKGVILTNECFTGIEIQNLFCNPRMYFGKRFLDIMPPFIAYGLLFGLFMPLCAKLEIILVPNFIPKQFPQYIAKYKPNHVVGVPSMWESLTTSKKINKRNLSQLMCAITGGDKMLPSTESEVNAFFFRNGCRYRVLKGYGMTEMSSAVSFSASDECNVLGSVGIPAVLNTIKIVKPGTSLELRYNEQGEVCITGPTMMLGYWENEEETNQVMHIHSDGKKWIHTRDIGYMNEDGVLFIVDRIKRMIVRPDGHNVWPSQIEAVISQHSSVAACAVVGKPNPDGANGQIPTAYIVFKEGVKGTESLIYEIDALSKEHLPERDVALAYHFIDTLPLTPIGKVDYRALEQMAVERAERQA